MSFIKEFREFAVKGNVIDVAVGVIIGAAFGKIVSSFVNDVVMPPIGILVGNVDFSDLSLVLKEKTAGSEAVVVKYGLFINTVIDFAIVALVIFLVIKFFNRIRKAQEEVKPLTPAESAEIKVLREIRDLLKTR